MNSFSARLAAGRRNVATLRFDKRHRELAHQVLACVQAAYEQGVWGPKDGEQSAIVWFSADEQTIRIVTGRGVGIEALRVGIEGICLQLGVVAIFESPQAVLFDGLREAGERGYN